MVVVSFWQEEIFFFNLTWFFFFEIRLHLIYAYVYVSVPAGNIIYHELEVGNLLEKQKLILIKVISWESNTN